MTAAEIARLLADAFNEQNAWNYFRVDKQDFSDVVIDGHYDLLKIAQFISEKIGEARA